MVGSGKKDKVSQEEMANSRNLIGKGTQVQGDVETFGNLLVEGSVKGNITTKSKVVLGETSQLDGNLLAQNCEIAGKVVGKVEVTELLVLKPTAKIEGDIITNKLIVEAGAAFNGSSKMGVRPNDIHLGDAAKNGSAASRKAEQVA